MLAHDIEEDAKTQETSLPFLNTLHQVILDLSEQNIISFLNSTFDHFTELSLEGDVDKLYVEFYEEIQIYFRSLRTPINPKKIKEFNYLLEKKMEVFSHWITGFPDQYVLAIKRMLKSRPDVNTIENIVGTSELEDFIFETASDITPRILSILGLLTQILDKEFLLTSDQVEIIENHEINDAKIEPVSSQQHFKQNLIRHFYYPIVCIRFYKSYLFRLKNTFCDLDKTIQRLPAQEVELIDYVTQIKSDLSEYLARCPTPENTKLAWELSRDTHVLTDFILSSIESCKQNQLIDIKRIDEKSNQYCNKWIYSNRIKNTDDNCTQLKKNIGAFLCGLLIFTIVVGLVFLSCFTCGINLLALILASSAAYKITAALSLSLGIVGSGLLGYCLFKQRGCFRSNLVKNVDHYQQKLLDR